MHFSNVRFVLCQVFGLNHLMPPFHAFFPPPPLYCFLTKWIKVGNHEPQEGSSNAEMSQRAKCTFERCTFCHPLTFQNPPIESPSVQRTRERSTPDGNAFWHCKTREVGWTPKWGFGVAMLPVGALCLYQAHFGRTVLPKWPLWAHLFCSVFYWECKYLMYCIFSCSEAPRLRQTVTVPGLDL